MDDKIVPDLREFRRLVLTMKKESVKDLESIYEVAKKIIRTQKTINQKEIIALETIDKALKS